MANLGAMLSAIDADITAQVEEVRRLRTRSEAKQDGWLNVLTDRRADAKMSWDITTQQLTVARQELVALRRKREILLGEHSSPGQRS